MTIETVTQYNMNFILLFNGATKLISKMSLLFYTKKFSVDRCFHVTKTSSSFDRRLVQAVTLATDLLNVFHSRVRENQVLFTVCYNWFTDACYVKLDITDNRNSDSRDIRFQDNAQQCQTKSLLSLMVKRRINTYRDRREPNRPVGLLQSPTSSFFSLRTMPVSI